METFKTGRVRRVLGRLISQSALIHLVLATPALAGNPAGDLRIEVIAGYNFVVDSNIESPSSCGPRSAYLEAKYCNDGTDPLTNVWAYIGDHGAGTPGIYPSRTHDGLTGPLAGGAFALTHEGGSLGVTDAMRYLGTIEPGECVAVYWLLSYPTLDETGKSVTGGVKPDDDLWLEYDIWGTAMDQGVALEADVTRTVNMRSMISAAANKILPNSANKVPQEYQDLLDLYAPAWTNTASDGSPGTVITAEGIWFDLGNIGAGFDNDGDLVPDRNVWLQPVGDPDQFDPSCFRLVRTHALLIIKLTDGTEQVIVADDQLYFTNLPENNRGAVGYVQYEFLSLGSGCDSLLSPYQTAASGKDNEKFNGDYGAGLGGGLSSGDSQLEIAKTVDRAWVDPGATNTYTIAFTNSGTVNVGQPALFLPLVIQDSIPSNTTYVAGSATAGNTLPIGVASYTVFFSTNHGAAWSAVEPATASDVTDLQWWLSEPLAPGAAGSVSFKAEVDSPFLGSLPAVLNTAGLSLGDTAPFATASATNRVAGNNAVGDMVYWDQNRNSTQDVAELSLGIPNVTVWLYGDPNGNGVIDTDEPRLSTKTTDASGYYLFTNLPDCHFIVVVDPADPDLPAGYVPTTPTSTNISLDVGHASIPGVTNLTADFGFAAVLSLTKSGSTTLREAGTATYSLVVSNLFPGTGGGLLLPATYTVWAKTNDLLYTGATANKQFSNMTNAWIPDNPDGGYASTIFANAGETLGLRGHSITPLDPTKAITNVTLLIPYSRSGNFRTAGGGDRIEIYLHTNNAPVGTYFFAMTNVANSITTGVYEVNVTAARAWTWADFSGTNISIRITEEQGTGNRQGGTIGFDQAGFRVQSSREVTAQSYQTINPAPLHDYYNTNILRFVSASPMVSLATNDGPAPNTGHLYWSNLGPIYPGGATTATVTFAVLEPPGNVAATTTNAAVMTNAMFVNGTPLNSATSKVASTVSPAGSIGDYVWRDIDGDGVQDGGAEAGIGGVSVKLTPPAGVDVGNGAGNPITNVTDETGYYLFTGLPADGNYEVTVLTATLPAGTPVNTWDRDGNNNSTTTVTLDYDSTTGGDKITNADFGYSGLQARITGSIWNDANSSGTATRDAGEPYLTNVTVRLYDTTGALVATTTATNGTFSFTGNYSGSYTVKVDNATGSLGTGTWTPTYDSDGTNTLHESAVTVASGGFAHVDFSYAQSGTYSIGDLVFRDWNGNGFMGSLDRGISNVTVRLYLDVDGDGAYDAGGDAYIGADTTDASGNYLFTDLPPAHYLVVVDLDDPDLPVLYHVTADPYSALDGVSATTLVDADDLDQDFGFQPYGFGTIGDTVWRDVNADGVQSGTRETGIEGVSVALQMDQNGDGIWNTTLEVALTDAQGKYLFTNVPDGNYRVWVSRADPAIPMDAFGNQWFNTTPEYVYVTISNGSTYLSADFGFAPLAALGDTIYWDANRNGTQDASEGGVAGTEVQLYYDTNGNGLADRGEDLVTNAVTDADGRYLFSGLMPGSYVVLVVTANGPLVGAVLSADPDSDGLTCDDPDLAMPCDHQHGRTLSSGQTYMGADFGYVPPGAVIGDTLWIDANNNGLRDPDEVGIPYVSVVLYSNGTAIATNETDADGYYYFSDLAAGTYHVEVLTDDPDFPAGVANTWTLDGSYDNTTTNIVIDGGAVISVGGTPCSDCDLAIDFGYRREGNNSLSGTIGLDATPYDGVLNGSNPSGVGAGETAYPGVPVYLYLWDDDGDDVIESGEYILVASTVTAANGDYSFTGLPAGDGGDQYIVSSAAPEADLKLTTTNGSIASVTVVETSNALGYTVSAYLVVDVAETITGMDFAYRSVKAYDYGDLPETYGTLLPGGARHSVPMTPNLSLGATVDTEINGVPSEDADGDDLADADDEDGVLVVGLWRPGVSNGVVEITVGAGAGWLAGYVDFDGDGQFTSPGEMICSLAVSNTGGNGAGLYTNVFDIPAGAFSSTSSTPFYARFRLFPSEPLLPELAFSGTADNGEVEDYLWIWHAIGGTVFMDADTDNVFSGGDTTLAGVVVKLYDGTTLLESTVTKADGSYVFVGLTNGSGWRVEMETPSGAAAILDADGNGNSTTNIAVTLSDASVLTNHFLLDPNAARYSISGRVWEDDGYGVVGNGEFDEEIDRPVPYVVVSLYRDIDGDGVAGLNEFIASVTANSAGEYAFLGFPEGDYIVIADVPSGLTSTTDYDGPDNGTQLIELALSGADATERNFLMDSPQSAALRGLVWLDENANGIQDPSEIYIFPNLPVNLYTADSNLFASTVSDGNGRYAFNHIPAGDYFVQFDLTGVSTDFYVTVPNNGNAMVDSDVIMGQTGDYGQTGPIVVGWGEATRYIDLGLVGLPTRVVLYSFTLGVEDGRVVARWRTASEERSVGFYLERWNGSQWVRVNDEIVYARGENGLGSAYALVDSGALPGGTYTYRVMELESRGAVQMYGPFQRTATALEFLDDMPISMQTDGVHIRWLSRPDEFYRILRSTNLLEGIEGFRPIATGIPASPPENEYLDEEAGTIGMYLIQIEEE